MNLPESLRQYSPKQDFTIYFDRKLVAMQRYRPLMYSEGDARHEPGTFVYPRQTEDWYLMSGCLDACELIPAGASAAKDKFTDPDQLVTLRTIADNWDGWVAPLPADEFVEMVQYMNIGG